MIDGVSVDDLKAMHDEPGLRVESGGSSEIELD